MARNWFGEKVSRFGVIAPFLSAALLLTSSPAAATDQSTHLIPSNSPVITSGLASALEVLEWFEIEGSGLQSVEKAYVDDRTAIFELTPDKRLRIQVPLGTNPGDAVLRLFGAFGLASYPSLVQVVPSSEIMEQKVTIGTFLGYAAVYTKNFKGKELTIAIEDRQRVIPNLSSDYTQNLTQIGSGKRVVVKVYLDQTLIQVRELMIR